MPAAAPTDWRWRRPAAAAAAAAIVLGAPIVGDLRLALLQAFPRYYVAIVSTAVMAGGVLMLGLCLRAIRTGRPRRFALVGLAAGLAAASFVALRSGDANVDAVEAFHFVEYGVLTLLLFPFAHSGARWEAYVEAALGATAVGVADEWLQWFVPGRAGEWRDVLFDLLATGCGLLLCAALDTRPPAPLRRAGSSDPVNRGLTLGLHATLVILFAGAFVAAVHLGSDIRDPGIGVFRSRFSADRLRMLGEESARRWAAAPPAAVGRYGREDQYAAEALWHVRRRNFAMDPDRNGDPVELDVAWHENQILERHFAAVMNAPQARHRLAPEQLADLEARRAHGTAPFVSDAEAMPLYAWPPSVWWAGIAALALTALGGGLWLDRTRRGRASDRPGT